MTIVVQRIVTTWTKATRGALDREARARLPKGYPLPDAALVSRAPCIRHFVSRRANEGYRVSEGFDEDTRIRATGGLSPTSIVLTETDGILEVAFEPEGDAGSPRRSAPAIRLAPGTWGRARYNGRFQSFDEPWYEGKIVNVAYGLPLVREMFTKGEPTAILLGEVDLW